LGRLILLLAVCLTGCDGKPLAVEEPLIPKGDSAWEWTLEFPSDTDLASVVRLLEQRFQAAGVDDIMIEPISESQLRLSPKSVAQEAKEIVIRLATMRGRVSFHRVDERSDLLEEAYEQLGSDDKDLIELSRSPNLGAVLVSADGARLTKVIAGIAMRGADTAGRSIAIQPPNESGKGGPRFTAYVVMTNPELDNGDIANVKRQEQTEVPAIDVVFTKSGAERLATLTRDHLGGRVAILLDDTVLTAPVVRQVIDEGQIQLRFGWGGSPDEVDLMARVWAFFIGMDPLPSAGVVVAEGLQDGS
jgi:preprotein translocase subunit SecD